mmetsp:Transcript_20512/g.51943  ORF Transcript_20512/g.51943 Transcript_20512/m.51943 type:complete len:170 (-) Transcript_20512:127-636(-)|eukprot:CAMPEP_0177659842 /NCGR_PEP_ID=MMETSP0447-20121125/17669_1 /TAXON_ID=0 /ORGANISM="Stygamoeba regulata, Strain BSH-02190019" /LENGTH=169 /DNA_ID=CAMNT_0019164761 /DNA_START=36 /DNA_END=545 /DNA_ORIENTATION=-
MSTDTKPVDATPVHVRGACHCKRFQVEANGVTVFNCLCHCSVCRRISGAPVSHFIGFPIDAVNLLREGKVVDDVAAEAGVLAYSTSDHLVRYSCARCSSPLFSHSSMEAFPFRDVAVGILDRSDPAVLPPKPAVHIFYVDRIMDLPDALPKFVGFPGMSELYKDDDDDA